MKPVIGSNVQFFSSKNAEPLHAVVAAVNPAEKSGEETVNIAVFESNGAITNRIRVAVASTAKEETGTYVKLVK